MGFFSKYNEIEKKLLEIYSKLFADVGLPDAEKMIEGFLDEAIEESKKAGRYNLKNVGDILLEKEKLSGQVNENFEDKRKEGVRDEDIRWWLNLNDIERMIMLRIDKFNRVSLYLSQLGTGKSTEEALDMVGKYHPIYGDIKNETHSKGDNRPLPFELKDRINIYIEKQGINNSNFKKKINSSSSFNALIRKEIREGNI